MKRAVLCGLAAIVGMVTLAGAAMAHHSDVDMLTMDLRADGVIYQMTAVPDLHAPVMVSELDAVPDWLTAAETAFQAPSLIEPLSERAIASVTLADDALRLWRVRTADVFTISPDLLI